MKYFFVSHCTPAFRNADQRIYEASDVSKVLIHLHKGDQVILTLIELTKEQSDAITFGFNSIEITPLK